MKVLKSCVIAFSMYSKIPVPQFAWMEEDGKYVLCFLPWVGAVIGGMFYGWSLLCRNCRIGTPAYLLVAVALPLLVTGGFHVDGFMDTMDAIHSYQSRERKLEILKDSHIGAFSVIMLLLYYLIWLAAASEITSGKAVGIAAIGFILSRCLGGIGAVTFQPARKDGMLKEVTDYLEKKKVLAVLLLQTVLCMAGMCYLSFYAAIFVLIGAICCFFYWRHMCYQSFGGITGDLTGYFITICEEVILIAAAMTEIAGRIFL